MCPGGLLQASGRSPDVGEVACVQHDGQLARSDEVQSFREVVFAHVLGVAEIQGLRNVHCSDVLIPVVLVFYLSVVDLLSGLLPCRSCRTGSAPSATAEPYAARTLASHRP